MDNVSADEKHVLYGVRVIVERQEIDNVWQPHRWVIHDLVPLNRVAGDGTPPINDIPLTPLRAGDEGLSMLFTADASLDLHHAEAEAYAENLASSDPAIYLVLRKNENSDDYEDVEADENAADRHVAEISLSPYNIQCAFHVIYQHSNGRPSNGWPTRSTDEENHGERPPAERSC